MGEVEEKEGGEKLAEASGGKSGDAAEAPEEKKGRRFYLFLTSLRRLSWRKALLAAVPLMAVSFLLYAVFAPVEKYKNISERVKVEGPENDSYDMPGFFIPLEEGKVFLRLKMSISSIFSGWKKKIIENPHIFREAVVRAGEDEEILQLLGPLDEKVLDEDKEGQVREKLKEKIEAEFSDLTGEGMLKIHIDELSII